MGGAGNGVGGGHTTCPFIIRDKFKNMQHTFNQAECDLECEMRIILIAMGTCGSQCLLSIFD